MFPSKIKIVVVLFAVISPFRSQKVTLDPFIYLMIYWNEIANAWSRLRMLCLDPFIYLMIY